MAHLVAISLVRSLSLSRLISHSICLSITLSLTRPLSLHRSFAHPNPFAPTRLPSTHIIYANSLFPRLRLLQIYCCDYLSAKCDSTVPLFTGTWLCSYNWIVVMATCRISVVCRYIIPFICNVNLYYKS